MTGNEIGEFIANIIATLHKNGFPEKKVSLPLEKMYEKAYEKGLNFNKVLEFLLEKGIAHEKTPEKVIFFTKPEESTASGTEANATSAGFGDLLKGFDPSILKGLDKDAIMSRVDEMWKNMNPEQMSQIRNIVDNLTPEQRDELMKMAKKGGLF